MSAENFDEWFDETGNKISINPGYENVHEDMKYKISKIAWDACLEMAIDVASEWVRDFVVEDSAGISISEEMNDKLKPYHYSDCKLHNMPTYLNGECSCHENH